MEKIAEDYAGVFFLGLQCLVGQGVGHAYPVAEEVADQKVKTAFLKVGEVKIELLEPTSPESTVAKFIEKNGFVEILFDFFNKFFKIYFYSYFWFKFDKIVVLLSNKVYTWNFTSIKKISNI